MRPTFRATLPHLVLLALAALLAACGGGSSAPASNPTTTTVNASAVKGPLVNAIACGDYNNNGVCDAGEPSVRTGSNGSFQLSLTRSAPIIVVVDEQTIDSVSGGALTPDTVLKAPAGATVVSPATSLLAAGASKEVVARALGLPLGTDPATYNPFSGTATDAAKLQFEKAALQVYTAISAVANGAAAAGVLPDQAYDAAFRALATIAGNTGGAVNFTNPAVITSLATATVTNLGSPEGLSTLTSGSLSNAVANVATAVNAISSFSSLTSTDGKQLMQVASRVLAEDVRSLVTTGTALPLASADPGTFQAALAQAKLATMEPVAPLNVASLQGLWQGRSQPSGTALSVMVGRDGAAWLVWGLPDTDQTTLKVSLEAKGSVFDGAGLRYALSASSTSAARASLAPATGGALDAIVSARRGDSVVTETVRLSKPSGAAYYDSLANVASMAGTWTGAIGGRDLTLTLGSIGSGAVSTGTLSGTTRLGGCTFAGAVTAATDGLAPVTLQQTCDAGTSSMAGLLYKNGAGQLTLLLTSGAKPVILTLDAGS